MLALLFSTVLGTESLGPAPPAPNLLLLVADDLGDDYVGIYEEGPPEHQPPTPSLDRLARSGVWFRNAYSCPACSATRSTILTGRYGFHTGIGDNVKPDDPGLADSERTIAEELRDAGYHCALIGKWHLGWEFDLHTPYPPIRQGFQWFAGSPQNFSDYFSYELLRANETTTFPTTLQTEYSPTLLVDLAETLISRLPEPWFVEVCFHAVHRPEHLPPTNLHHYGGTFDPQVRFQAMVEALDTEIGRLLSSPALEWRRTTVLFLGDNGTEAERTRFGPDDYPRAKGSLTEAGINVPLVAAGYGVQLRGGESPALVNTTDLYATLLDLAGVGSQKVPSDSKSFAGVLADPASPGPRSWVYSESFPNHGSDKQRRERMARGTRFKLHFDDRIGRFEFHDLGHDHQENRVRTLLCEEEASEDGYRRCRRQLDKEPRREFQRLLEVLEELDSESR